jgi:hypothetical protein
MRSEALDSSHELEIAELKKLTLSPRPTDNLMEF